MLTLFTKKYEAQFNVYCDTNEISDAMKIAKESGISFYAWNTEKLGGMVNRVQLQLFWHKATQKQIQKAAISFARKHKYAMDYKY